MTGTPPIRVKICGLRDAATVDAAVEAGADWVGFVFFEPSPRWITPARAAVLAARVPATVGTVGLFVDPTESEVEAVLGEVRLSALQVYAASSHIAALRARFGVPVWRAIGVAASNDLPVEAEGADRLVIEARRPPSATRPGGNATAFDWSLLCGWNAPVPWLLAGGLTPGNVGQAISETGAQAVDVSSGVESAPGIKSPVLIREFIASARAGRG